MRPTCPCSGKHVPAPIRLAPIETATGRVVWLCPTAIDNLQQLMVEYKKAGGTPLGSVMKHYGKFIRDLAAEPEAERKWR
jgi:hypothetical protein